MAKRLVTIGDRFGTWEIIGLEENDRKYNYNYMCKCDCGNVRMIRKDKLVNFTYPKCNKCLSNGTIDRKWDLIKSRWNFKLNGALVHSELELKKYYTWNCPKGHIYRDSIFMLEEDCPKCRELRLGKARIERSKARFDEVIDYLEHVCDAIWEDNFEIKIDETAMVIWLEVNGFIVVMTPTIHNCFNEVLHETKSNYYQLLANIKGYKQSAIEDAREHIFMDLTLSKKDFEKIKLILGIVNSK